MVVSPLAFCISRFQKKRERSTLYRSPKKHYMPNSVLTVDNLQTHFHTDSGTARAVDGVSFTLNKGETYGLVGESGCGKSVSSLSIMRLVPNPGRIESGHIFFQDRDLISLSETEMRDIRGNDIAMIFQEPMTSLNPVYTCGFQIDEAVRRHQGLKKNRSAKKNS